MKAYCTAVKEKMLELTRLFCIENNIFQRFVIVYKYITLIDKDPVTKEVLQGIFDSTVKVMGEAGVLGSTKGNKIRYIPMTQDLYDHLITLEPKDGFLLKGPDGLRFRPECSRTNIHAICEKAKLRQIGWHKLRHTFASRLAEKGVALLTIKELMGHSDVRTTMRYAHLGQHTLRDAIKVLETSHVFDLRHHSVTHEDLGVTNSMLPKREIAR